jgi:hypothetical protein
VLDKNALHETYGGQPVADDLSRPSTFARTDHS